MDAAEKLLFENINRNIEGMRSDLNVMSTNISKLFTQSMQTETRLAELYKQHDERACYIDEFNALKKEFDEHKIYNGFSTAQTEKHIDNLNKDVAPVRTIKAGWAILIAIIAIVGTLTFVQVKINNMMNYIKTYSASAITEVQP